ncbi:hypothetical protein Golax_022631 [Gossypium laxum]|uniref:Uncharacterized protein n=1 Tax=Gossypium laxum TaxID=34288 RepID=A0A7J9B365_9ROSI|nr:hypothetical protein [Gossypium laxum]
MLESRCLIGFSLKIIHLGKRWWLYQGGMISWRESGRCFQMRFYIVVVILIWSPYLGFGELLAMHCC